MKLAYRLRETGVAALRGLVLSVVSLGGSIVLLVACVLSLALIPLGIGAFTTPWAVQGLRHFANWRRLWAAQWCGVRIPPGHRPFPEDLRPGVIGQLERCRLVLRDPATWRELCWLPFDMTVGFLTAVLTVGLAVYPLEGFALGAGLWRAFTDGTRTGYWYGFVPIDGQVAGIEAALLGLALLTAALFLSPRLLLLHFRLTGAVLAPGKGELSERVRVLTETRRDAVDTSAAELRRIERDLHDGAQARLVAVGMDLGTITALMDHDPAKAKQLLLQARQSSAEALTELRDLVRGIHPPVLAERGLGDAVRALALRLPVPSEVHVQLPGRAPEPVESAAYFALSEVLTNAVKHAGAERIWVDLHHEGGALRMSVTDNGGGGAVVGAGSGLSGVERRLGTFDGVLAVSSPAGGPTMVTMEIPCALS
ncbi:sensor histidine kinase [Streptomyces physcomitrii]|uniref:histidine kinase n=1 Tax=Streptomyces physcomitrii TaxID=2724184 RepID=A0ABX1H3J0_9ACTN|nr:sensor histidine kinase [Streptomyces physcomitrii]NKI42920.1 sensor histidine kinase [Streptomyces physcomitrii]